MRKSTPLLLLATALSLGSTFATAQEQRPYAEGTVTNVSFIRTEPGKFEEYMRYLATTYKQLMEEQKKAGIVVDYAVYLAEPRDANDANLILTTTYKNWAALDGLSARTDPIDAKVWGTLAKAEQASGDRGALRRQLGSQTIQELVLK